MSPKKVEIASISVENIKTCKCGLVLNMDSNVKKSVTMHLPKGTSYDRATVTKAKTALVAMGIDVRILGENEYGNVAAQSVVVVLPQGTKLHGVGDLCTRVEEAFRKEEQQLASLKARFAPDERASQPSFAR